MRYLNSILKNIAIGFVIISALVMAVIWHELEDTKRDFASRLLEQSSDRVRIELTQFFIPVERQLKTLIKQRSIAFLDDFSTGEFNELFIPIIEEYPQISSVGFGDYRGYELDITPDSTQRVWLNREVHVDEWGMIENWSSWSIENGLVQINEWQDSLLIDPRNRPWYTGAVEAAGRYVYWTEPYMYQTTKEIGITASILWGKQSLTDSPEVMAYDVTLKDLTNFSQGLSITKNNQIFILTDDQKIIGLPKYQPELTQEEANNKLLLTAGELGNNALIRLLEVPTQKISTFDIDGEAVWGIIVPYRINETQQLLIGIIIPESDFATDINNTQKAMGIGFLVILILASLLVMSNHRLRKAKITLIEQNDIITDQRGRLYREVHHRVKNNLAVMSALMELESLDSEDMDVKNILTQNHRRIKSMSAVHEIMYKTEDLNKVEISEFIPRIIEFNRKDFKQFNIELDISIDDVLINVNQALTYALLLNEFMISILKSELDLTETIIIDIAQQEGRVLTVIQIRTNEDHLEHHEGVGKQLIAVLLSQLSADLNTHKRQEFIHYEISFELKDIKGPTSNF